MGESEKNSKGFFRSLLDILKASPDVPDSLEDNPTLKLIFSRRSIRHFKDKPVPEEAVKAILEAGRMAPSGVNLQTWTFICFSRDSWQERFSRSIPFNGQRAIIILADTHRVDQLGSAFDFPEAPLVMHTMAVFNAGLAAMNMTLAAEACGLSSIMLSETGKTGLLDVGELKEKLGLPDGAIPITTLVIGYRRAGVFPIPPRLPLNAICGQATYPEPDQGILLAWEDEMKAGYRAMRPRSSFEAQVAVYAQKIQEAEAALKAFVLKD